MGNGLRGCFLEVGCGIPFALLLLPDEMNEEVNSLLVRKPIGASTAEVFSGRGKLLL